MLEYLLTLKAGTFILAAMDLLIISAGVCLLVKAIATMKENKKIIMYLRRHAAVAKKSRDEDGKTIK
jgi:large-conductance mechanosensitive channel